MKLVRVEFTKLFGYFDYSIDFHDTVTILHGLNGCGKTTMLQTINAVFNKEMDTIKSTDLQSVSFFFSTGAILKIDRKKIYLDPEKEKATGIIYLAYSIIENGKETVFDSFENTDEYQDIVKRFLKGYRPFPFLERINESTWYDRKRETKLNLEEVIAEYGTIIFRRYSREYLEDDIPQPVQDILASMDVRLIAADRLTVAKRVERQYGEDNIKIERRVNLIAKDLSQKIRDTIQQYAQLSQAKDRTFPLRAIKQSSPLTVDEIKSKMIELESKRKEFVDTGILEEEQDDIGIHDLLDAITESNRQNLSLYAIDTEEKLNALSSLSSSINLFRNLIDKNFNNKRIVFNKDYGFRFVATYSDSTILPQSLSSGEQHELVMFYDLIFNASENTLILIDEPELSLHIKWQLDYVDELLQIISATKFSAVLATHSPQIIHDKWDLTVSLSE
ncbi:AAA family ATPase [Faecalibacterium duncaniae]|jgi:predicted ATP-binding protein involved in virulence|uniref:AAA family ATPase n=1 Tax=Faecalibacterium TaxID=216851 RepID=UPI0012DFD721|nr:MULTISPECIES: AAA family ATPase [Faecalibacterium]MBO1304418.1 AAA family ATPase [Faecalibacterium sp. Marseille-Q4137]UQK50732.1 AAA family ATPase [Faecalibacterium sp. IP-3-29]